MKKLTDSQKKWALTACLMSALSFNMVMNLSNGNTMGRFSFASSSGAPEVGVFDIGDTHYNALYSPDNKDDKKTHVHLLVKTTEGGTCPTCHQDDFVLDAPFTSNVEDLNKITIAKKEAYNDIAAKEKVKKDAEAKKDDTAATSKHKKKTTDDDDSTVADDDGITKLKDKCAKKRNATDRQDCLVSGFADLVTDQEHTYDKTEIMKLFKSKIAKGIVDELNSSDEDRQDTANNFIETVVGQISSTDYPGLRKAVIQASQDAVKDNARALQSTVSRYRVEALKKKANPNYQPDMGLIADLNSSYYSEATKILQLNGSLSGSIHSSLNDALDDYDMTGVNQNLYNSLWMDTYQTPETNLLRSLAIQPTLAGTLLGNNMSSTGANLNLFQVPSNTFADSSYNGDSADLTAFNAGYTSVAANSFAAAAVRGGRGGTPRYAVSRTMVPSTLAGQVQVNQVNGGTNYNVNNNQVVQNAAGTYNAAGLQLSNNVVLPSATTVNNRQNVYSRH